MPFESLGVVSYSHSIVTMAVSVAFVIYPASKHLTLETGLGVVQDHLKWRGSIDHVRLSIDPPL